MEIPLLFILSQSFSNLQDISVFNSFQVIWCVWQTSYLYVCSPFWSCCRAVRSNCSIGELVMISSRGIWHYFFCLRSMQPQWDIDLWIYYTRYTYNYIAIRYKNPCKAPEASPAELLRITTTSMSPVCRAKPRKVETIGFFHPAKCHSDKWFLIVSFACELRDGSLGFCDY